MFFSKNVLTIEKNRRILPKLLVFPLKKKSRKGGQSGKNPTIGGDLYDQGGSKNRGFHNGRNFGGHILTEHPVYNDTPTKMFPLRQFYQPSHPKKN